MPGIQPQLGRLLLHHFPVGAPIAQGVPNGEGAAGELQIGEPPRLGVPADLIDPGAEDGGPDGLRGKFRQQGKEFVHSLQPQAGAEADGEKLPGLNEADDLLVGHMARSHIGFQGPVVQHGQRFLVLHREGHAALAEAGSQVRKQLRPALPGGVHLGDEDKGGHPAPPQQGPKGLRVGLDPVRAADDQDPYVHGGHGPLGLAGQIRMARGIQKGQLQLVRPEPGLLGEDGDAPLPLQGMGIQKGIPMVHPAQLPEHAGAKQQRFGQGGLPRVHVGQNAGGQFFDCPRFVHD